MPLMVSMIGYLEPPLVYAVIQCDECGQLATLRVATKETARAIYIAAGWAIYCGPEGPVAECWECRSESQA